jgi:phage shock protein A
MGILNRLNTLIRSNVNDLISGSSEPDRVLDRSIGDMEGSLVEARQHAAKARAAEKRLLREWDDVRDEALDWEDKAMEALRLGDEELARDCLLMKRKLDTKADKIREDLEQQRAYMGDLGKSLDALETKLDSVRARRRTVDRKVVPGRDPHRPPHRGEGRRRPSGVTLPFDSDRPRRQALAFDDDIRRDNPEAAFGAEAPFEHFDAIEDRIESRVADAEAGAFLEDPLDDGLDGRFKALESERDVRRLKERAASEPEPQKPAARNPASDLRRRLLEELEG